MTIAELIANHPAAANIIRFIEALIRLANRAERALTAAMTPRQVPYQLRLF